jgi:predicted transcriptional regulator
VTRRHIHARPLTDLQQAILDCLWRTGPATAERVRDALRLHHPLKDSSVRTLLRRLEARGFVSHRVEGKVFVYRADVQPQSVAAVPCATSSSGSASPSSSRRRSAPPHSPRWSA